MRGSDHIAGVDQEGDLTACVTDTDLEELSRRIVAAVHPKRILLFGSTARGERGPSSDIDLLIVMPDGVHRRRTAQTIHLSLAGVGHAKDIIVVTESDVLQYGDNPSLVIHPALREGRELYHAPG